MTQPSEVSEGGMLIAEAIARSGAAEVARRVKTSTAMVRHMANGRRTPGDELKERIRSAYGAPLEAWGRPASPREFAAAPPTVPGEDITALGMKMLAGGAAARDVPAPPPPATKGGIAGLRASIAHIERTLAEAEADKLIPIQARTQLHRVRVDAYDRLARLTGEGELSWAAIRRSAVFQAFAAQLERAVAKHPAAAADVATVFERIEAGA